MSQTNLHAFLDERNMVRSHGLGAQRAAERHSECLGKLDQPYAPIVLLINRARKWVSWGRFTLGMLFVLAGLLGAGCGRGPAGPDICKPAQVISDSDGPAGRRCKP